jgi:putative membrane protein
MTDPNIVAMVSMSNAAEIQAGEAAQRKATNAQVKAFAADMVREHRAMQKMADSLAQANTQLAPQPAAAADSAQNAMKAASDSLTAAPRGAEFDRMYMAQQVAAHQKTLQDLNNFQTMAQDQNLRTMIQGAIPKVQQHLDRARQIHSSLGTP